MLANVILALVAESCDEYDRGCTAMQIVFVVFVGVVLWVVGGITWGVLSGLARKARRNVDRESDSQTNG